MPKTIPDFLERRLPARNDIFLALSLAAFLVFTWSLRAFFFSLPAFLLSQTPGEILVVVAYMLAFALLETLFMMFTMLGLAVILPGWLLKEGFSYKASFFFLASGVIFIHLQYGLTNQPTLNFLLRELGLILVLWIIPVLLTRYIGIVRKIVLDILDRLTIFSYVYLPLGVISLVVILIRLIW